jgi:CP family cyanate transporter-like MFS transporter
MTTSTELGFRRSRGLDILALACLVLIAASLRPAASSLGPVLSEVKPTASRSRMADRPAHRTAGTRVRDLRHHRRAPAQTPRPVLRALALSAPSSSSASACAPSSPNGWPSLCSPSSLWPECRSATSSCPSTSRPASHTGPRSAATTSPSPSGSVRCCRRCSPHPWPSSVRRLALRPRLLARPAAVGPHHLDRAANAEVRPPPGRQGHRGGGANGRTRRLGDPCFGLTEGRYMAMFFGLQSANAYVQFGWVPQIYRDAGLDPFLAGIMLTIVTFGGLPGGFLAPQIIVRGIAPRAFLVSFGVSAVAGYLGLLLLPPRCPAVGGLPRLRRIRVPRRARPHHLPDQGRGGHGLDLGVRPVLGLCARRSRPPGRRRPARLERRLDGAAVVHGHRLRAHGDHRLALGRTRHRRRRVGAGQAATVAPARESDP